VYASIWRFRGDPDDLQRRYDALLTEVPTANMRLHLCLRAPDGLVVVDTCPSQQVFAGFVAGPFSALLERHGLPQPAIEDGPVHRAFADGAELP
jgi:hypothetical protein